MRRLGLAGRSRSSWSGDERGSATLEITVLFPVVLAIVFVVIQGALYYHARNVALAAAADGLAVARSRGGSAGAGQNAASDFLHRAGGSTVLPSAAISASRGATTASVTVTGRSISLVPGIPGWAVSQTAAGPVERFTRPGNP